MLIPDLADACVVRRRRNDEKQDGPAFMRITYDLDGHSIGQACNGLQVLHELMMPHRRASERVAQKDLRHRDSRIVTDACGKHFAIGFAYAISRHQRTGQ